MYGLTPLYEIVNNPMDAPTSTEPVSSVCKLAMIKNGNQHRTNKTATVIIIQVTFFAVFMASTCRSS